MKRKTIKPALYRVFFALIATLVSACNNGGEGGSSDTNAPTIVLTSPADGASKVLTNSTLSATFSEPMDDSTITSNTFTLSFNPQIAGSVGYDAATHRATFTPSTDLPAGKVFTAKITTGARDQAGNGLTADKSWSFTSEESIYRVSVGSNGQEGDDYSSDCEFCTPLSDDGRYIAFVSAATNLVSGDTNGVIDAFRHDWETGTTVRVSLPNLVDQGALGTEGNNIVYEPSISADGRYVAFYSQATNLVLVDANGKQDVFVHDTQTGETTCVSLPHGPDQGTLGAESNGNSERASMSADGRYVVFSSFATNLVINDTNNSEDVFVHDRQTGETERVSVDSNGNQAGGGSLNASISADGRFVAFESTANDLVPGDTNLSPDIFVHDRQTGGTERVSVDSNGNQAVGTFNGNPSISTDGRYVAFLSTATNLVAADANNESDIFVHDRQTGETTRVSIPNAADQGILGAEANNGSQYPSISGNGRYVAFSSDASNLVVADTAGHWDVFVHDRQTGTTRRVSLKSDGTQGDIDTTDWASISANGRYVTFSSPTGVYIDGDANGTDDVFRALNATVP
jgi:Tol biopolymer transport system component